MGDIRPEFREDGAESQTAEGGFNWNDNCVPTSFAMVMDSLGYGDPAEPQDWTSFEYGPSFHGPEAGEASIDFIRKHPNLYPNPPGMWHEAPADPASRVIDLLNQRKPTVVYFNCLQSAKIVTYPTAYGHASVPVGDNGNAIAVWNVWTGYEQVLSRSDFNRACMGSLCVFDRVVSRGQAAPPAPIIPAPPPPPPPPPPMEVDLLNQVVKWPDQHQEKFRITGGLLQHIWDDPAHHQWSKWTSLVADATGTGVASIDGLIPVDNTLEVHATKTDGSSVHYRLGPNGWQGWGIG